MLTGIVALFAVTLIPNPISQQNQDSSLSSKEIVQNLQAIVAQIEGRILGVQIRKGMTTQQVDQILGNDPLCLENRAQIGVVSVAFRRFFTYGVIVTFSSDHDSVLRVQDVSYFEFSSRPFVRR
jgi:hypothetical protein